MKISRRKPRGRRQYVRVRYGFRVWGDGFGYIDETGKPVGQHSEMVEAWVPLCRLPKIKGVNR